MNKKKLNLEQVKKFLLRKGLVIKKKNRKNFIEGDTKSLYLTALSSLGIILFFYIS